MSLKFSSLGVLEEGYYKSNSEDRFGATLNRYYRFIEGSSNKQFVNFSRITNEQMIKTLSSDNFWKTIDQERKLFSIVPDVVKMSNKENERIAKEALLYLIKFKDDEKIQELIDYFTLDDIRKYNFSTKKENYFPNNYPLEVVDAATIEEINRIKDEIDVERDKKVINNLKKEIVRLEQKLRRETYEEKNILNQKIAYSTHRTGALSGINIRKDGKVPQDYMKFVSYIIEKNNASALALKTIVTMIKHNGNKVDGLENRLKYLLNKSKQAFGDADIDIPSVFPIISNQRFANIINKFVGDEDFKVGPEDASRYIKIIKSLVSANTLDSESAGDNRWQVTSGVIPFGWNYFKRAQKIMTMISKNSIEGKEWNRILQHSGIENVFSLLSDVVFLGGEVNEFDRGFIDLGAIKIPTINAVDFWRLFRAGRESFINNKSFLDKFFKPLANRRIEKLHKSFNRLEQKAKNEVIKNEVRYLKNVFYQIMFADESENNRQNLTKLFKELLVNISVNKIGTIVSWKLGWWISKDEQKVKTFTGTEEKIRKELALMALLTADEMGAFGASSYNKNDMKRFYSKTAVDIMRTSSYNFAFGINKVYLPFIYEGTGGVPFQFKNYPMNQFLLDARNFQNLLDTSDEVGKRKLYDAVKRIMREGNPAKLLFGENKKEMRHGLANVNLFDESVDQSARAFLRGLYVRGTATIMTTLSWLGKGIPLLKSAGISMRGLENPLFALIFRRVFIGSLTMFLYGLTDKDKDKGLQDLLFFIVPPAFSVLLNALLDSIEPVYRLIADIAD